MAVFRSLSSACITMRKTTFLVLLTLVSAFAFGQRDPLINEYKLKGGAITISNISDWRIREQDLLLNSIGALPNEVKQNFARQADDLLKKPWSVIRPTDYSEYRENGNRVNFENLYLGRRSKLSVLCVAELATGKSKYLPEIVKGLNLILAETTWVLPAHHYTEKRTTDPDPSDPIIDLFAAETAADLVWIKLLLTKQLEIVAPKLVSVIDLELEKRVLKPYMERNDYWWMGLNDKGKQNNWNIWINSNMLKVAAIAKQDSVRRTAMIEKIIRSSDSFVNSYAPDGGCDEGPSYWSAAGGCLGEFITLLNRISDGRLTWNKNGLIKNIGSYIYKVQIDGRRFVNFADAPASTIPDPGRVYNFGQHFKDQDLKSFASYLVKLFGNPGTYLNAGSINTFAGSVRTFKDLTKVPPKAPLPEKNWFPNLQMVNLRAKAGNTKGLAFMAKAGNNDESHNHNDVGNFMIYADGDPVLIDLGKGTYTRETFSRDRYKLWYIQSGWHNCPTINGSDEHNGPLYEAEHVKFSPGKTIDRFHMDLAKTFPLDAGIKNWTREFDYDRQNKQVVLRERYELLKSVGATQLNFIACKLPVKEKDGVITLSSMTGASAISMNYDAALFDVTIESKIMDDESLKSVWGKSVYRIILKRRGNELKGGHQIVFNKCTKQRPVY
ncbi:MAG TPA: heparinase II/III family protein [Pedobacter sp.]|nr:heparinase II/III family protein [Pedobacter sp.]